MTNNVRQLQCDIQRPCTLCLRAGATCSAAVRPTVWKNHGPGQGPKLSRLNSGNSVELPAAKRPRRAISVENVDSPLTPTTSPPPDSNTITGSGKQNRRDTPRDRVLSSPRETSPPPWVSSSAAVQFMEEVSKGRSCRPTQDLTSGLSFSTCVAYTFCGVGVPPAQHHLSRRTRNLCPIG